MEQTVDLSSVSDKNLATTLKKIFGAKDFRLLIRGVLDRGDLLFVVWHFPSSFGV
tara:strand:- start:947 stop:1111 length:165 start_codon:yes stop_codon:yes gene_type:complete